MTEPLARMAHRPASAAHFIPSCVASVAGLALLELLEATRPERALENGLIACLAIALMLAGYDVAVRAVHRAPFSGLEWNSRARRRAVRVGIKLVGLLLTLSVFAIGYWLFPEYRSSFYSPWWEALRGYGAWLLAAAPLYFWWLDAHLRRPEDAYWEVGMLLAGRRPSSWRDIRQHFAGWTVKAFFLPLMVGYLTEEVNVAHVFFHQPFTGAALFDFGYHLSYLLDLLFGVVGYCCTFRVIDTHIRSTEPTPLGWLAALVCYPPFFALIDAQFLRYEDGIRWSDWLADSPQLKVLWGSAIVALLFVYAASSMAFGLRFSNLTHRGVITSGPYRYTKHPAYLAKNLSWWLISVPFISQSSFGEGLRNCLALATLNLLYVLRARTEEKHLSRDPDYVAYAQWIEERGLLRKLRCLRLRLPSFISIFPRGTT